MQEECQWVPEVAEACQPEPVVVQEEALVAKDSKLVLEESGEI